MDTHLDDDTLKLVKYNVVFLKHPYEHVFPQRESLFADNMDPSLFRASKIAEFIDRLGDRTTSVPTGWGNTYPKDYREGDVLTGLPPEDVPFLRVHYEVARRYPNQSVAQGSSEGSADRQFSVFDVPKNKMRLLRQRDGFRRGHETLSQDIAKVLAKYKDVGEFESIDVSEAMLCNAFRRGLNCSFDPTGLDNFTGRWTGTNHHYDRDGAEIVADATTWHMTWSDGAIARRIYTQTVVGSKRKHYTIDAHPPLDKRAVDIALNVYRKDIGIAGWLSMYVESRNEIGLIAYELKPNLFLWIGQILDDKFDPVANDVYWAFLEWYSHAGQPDCKPHYYMYGVMFAIDFEAGTARHVAEQGVRKSRFDLADA